MNELARLRLSQDEDRLAFLYLDGHIREYSRPRLSWPRPRKHSGRWLPVRRPTRGCTMPRGSPLLVVTSEMNAGLTQVLEAIVRRGQEVGSCGAAADGAL